MAAVAANSLYTRIAATPATPATLLCLAKAQYASLTRADAAENDTSSRHKIAILSQMLSECRNTYGVQFQLGVELGRSALPFHRARHHEIEDTEYIVGDLALLKLLLAGLLNELPLAIVHADLIFLKLHISSRHRQRGPVSTSVEVVEDHRAVGSARDSIGSANGVKHVGVAHLTVVVDA